MIHKKTYSLVLLALMAIAQPALAWETGDGSNAKDSDGNDVGRGDSGDSGGKEGNGGDNGSSSGPVTTCDSFNVPYALISNAGPLNYKDAYNVTKTQYPREALAYQFMYPRTSIDAKYYSEAANFKFRSSEYKYHIENFSRLDVNYVYQGGALGASLTHSPSLAYGSAANAALPVKQHLLSYLNAKSFNSLNFDYEQQFRLRECSGNSRDSWVCSDMGKRRLLLPFKFMRGENPNEIGAFFGASVEADPDDAPTTSTPVAQLKNLGTLDITYYANDPVIDFYMTPGNAAALAPYEPDGEAVTYQSKRTLNGNGWFKGTRTENGVVTDMKMAEEYGSNKFRGVLPIDLGVSNQKGNPLTNYSLAQCENLSYTDRSSCFESIAPNIDLSDAFGSMVTSMVNTSQCFYNSTNSGSDCEFDVRRLMIDYVANKVNITTKSRFVLNGVRAGHIDKSISYDYCLSPIMNEKTSVYYSVKQYSVTKNLIQDNSGNIVAVGQTQPDVTATVNLPDPVEYNLNSFAWQRNDTDDAGGSLDTFFKENSLNVNNANLRYTSTGIEPMYLSFGGLDANIGMNITETGEMDKYKQWTCHQSFGKVVADEVAKYTETCGGVNEVVSSRIEGATDCVAYLYHYTTCENKPIPVYKTVQVSPGVTAQQFDYYKDNYVWNPDNIERIYITLPEDGKACFEACDVPGKMDLKGYCEWRENATGRKYKPS